MKKMLCIFPVLLLCCAAGARADGILLASYSDNGGFGGGVNTSILPPLPVADSLQISVGTCLLSCLTPDLTAPTLNILALASRIPVQDSLSPIPAGASNVQIFASPTPQVFNIGPSDPNFNAVAGSIENGTATGWQLFITPMSAAGQSVGGGGGGSPNAFLPTPLPLYADVTGFQIVVSPFEIMTYTDAASEANSDNLVPTYTVTTNIFGIPDAFPPPPPPPPPVSATPEPASILLMLLGASMIFSMRKRLVMHTPRTA